MTAIIIALLAIEAILVVIVMFLRDIKNEVMKKSSGGLK